MGASKIRERLARLYPDIHIPTINTVHAVDRHGPVKRRGRRRYLIARESLQSTKEAYAAAAAPNFDAANYATRRGATTERQRQNPISLPVASPFTIIDGTSTLFSLGASGFAGAFA